MVTGKPGTGKSILTDWIVERLERLQGVKATDVVVCKIRKWLDMIYCMVESNVSQSPTLSPRPLLPVLPEVCFSNSLTSTSGT